ncbi:MAG: hypothetical protein KAH17_06520 [Bacteroidales bacterium]|nr:hypothetical protein [Bacteroidales bacterium]
MRRFWKYGFKATAIIIMLGFLPMPGFSQKLHEEKLVLDFFESLYQYDFEESNIKLAQINKGLADQPEVYISISNYYWWLLMTGRKDNHFSQYFEEANLAVITKYRSVNSKQLSSDELFAIIHGYAYQTRYALYKKKYYKGLSNLKKVMPYLREVLENPRKNEKFSLLAGLYHYLAAITVAERPLLKPFFRFAPEYDRKFGYQLLLSAAQSSHPLISNEAKYYLMKINLEISENFYEAIKWNQILVDSFPENILYRYYLMQSMAKLGRIKEMKEEFIIIQNLSESIPWLTPDQRLHFVNEAALLIKKIK